MRIYFLRHGQTDVNVKRLLQGMMPSVLNENGIEQARTIREHIVEQDIHFDAVYSSPLERAIATTEIVTGLNRDEFTIEPRLEEMHFGVLEGHPYDNVPEEYQSFFKAPSEYDPPEGGETFHQCIARWDSFFSDLTQKHSSQDVILCTSHGTYLHAVMNHIRQNPMNELWKEYIGNCELIPVDYNGKTLTVADDERLGIDRRKKTW